jgi:hypothetical protein
MNIGRIETTSWSGAIDQVRRKHVQTSFLKPRYT